MGSNSSKSSVVLTQSAPNLSGQARVDMRQRDFDALIWGKSYDIFVDKALKCPCRTLDNNQALSSCRNCGGSGWVFINRRRTKAVLQSMNLDTKFKEWSQEMVGTSKMTFLANERVQFMDRITVTNTTIGTQQTLHTKFIEGAIRTKATYPIIEVEEMFMFVSPTDPLVHLKVDEDYVIEGNYITLDEKYNDGTNPSYTISIRYRHNPQYYILDLLRATMTSKEKINGQDYNSNMPISAMTRLCHYVIDEENFSNTYLHDNSYKDDCPK